MRVLFDVGHPAHVHLFKNTFKQLIEDGHKVYLTTKNNPSIISLLEENDLDYKISGKSKNNLFFKGVDIFKQIWITYFFCLNKKIDIGISSNITLPIVSRLIPRLKSITLDDDDDEVEPLFVKFGHTFTHELLSPESLLGKRKLKRTIYYPGFHELAYLHPNQFKPNPKVLDELKINNKDPFFILRFSAFNAHHDTNAEGISKTKKINLVNLLTNYGKVFITSENPIEKELEQYRLKIKPSSIHSLLYYSALYIGDSQTMASESAILGTPSFRCNSFKGKISYLNELEDSFFLTYSYFPDEFDLMLEKIKLYLNNLDLNKHEHQEKTKILLDKKIDVSPFLCWFIVNYPKSPKFLRSESLKWEKFK